jgi:class 3 adenylate cyclase
MAETRAETSLLIAFLDLTRFFAQSQRTGDAEIAETLDAFYEHVASAVGDAGGTVVKFLGDAALVVFPADAVDRGVETLLDLKDSVDDLLAERGWECRLAVKAHFGSVVAGPYGGAGAKRYDVLGKAVNVTAGLEGTGVTLSVEAFRRLGPELRASFKKHTPPITYIRLLDRRARAGRG